jgi:hypothetical protein
MSRGRPADDPGPFRCLNEACPGYGKRGAGTLAAPMRYGPRRPLRPAGRPPRAAAPRRAGGSSPRGRPRPGWMRTGPSPAGRGSTANPDREADRSRGDRWGHVALDPDRRPARGVVAGKRPAGTAVLRPEGAPGRPGGRAAALVSGDGPPAYPAAPSAAFGVVPVPPRAGRPGRPAGPRVVPPPGLTYGTVHKTRRNGRVVRAEAKAVYGAAPAGGISTSDLGRPTGTATPARPAGRTGSRGAGRRIRR